MMPTHLYDPPTWPTSTATSCTTTPVTDLIDDDGVIFGGGHVLVAGDFCDEDTAAALDPPARPTSMEQQPVVFAGSYVRTASSHAATSAPASSGSDGPPAWEVEP